MTIPCEINIFSRQLPVVGYLLFLNFDEKGKHMKIELLTERCNTRCNIHSVIQSTIYNLWIIFNSHFAKVKICERTFYVVEMRFIFENL